MTNPVGQYPVGRVPVGGYYPSVAAQLYNVAATCYVTAAAQIAKTANLTRVIFAIINSQISKMVGIIRTFYVIAITLILKRSQISRIVYIIAIALSQKNVNLSRIVYVVMYSLTAKILNLTRSIYVIAIQQIQKAVTKIPLTFYVIATETIQRSISLARNAYITAIVLISSHKSYFRSFVAYVIITEQANKSIVQAAKLCFIPVKNLLQKSIMASRAAYIIAVVQTNRAIAASRTAYVNVVEQLQKAVNWTRIAYIPVLTNIQKQVNLFRFDYLLVIANAITASTHQYFVSAIAYVAATMTIQKQANIFRNVYGNAVVSIQKQAKFSRNYPIVAVLLIQKQINLSRLTVASAITLLQKRIIQAGQFAYIGIIELGQKSINVFRSFYNSATVSLQRAITQSTKTFYVVVIVPAQKSIIQGGQTTSIGVLSDIQKQIALFRVTTSSITANIQKQINIGRVAYVTITEFSAAHLSYLIAVTAYLITTASVPQKAINQAGQTFLVGTNLLLQRAVRGIRTFAPLIQLDIQKQVQHTQATYINLSALFFKTRAHLLTFTTYLSAAVSNQKQIELFRNAYINTLETIQKRITILRNIFVSISFNRQNTIDQSRKIYVLAATFIQKQINLYRYIFGELNIFIQKQISFLTNIFVTISVSNRNQVGLFYETIATVGIQVQKQIRLFRTNFVRLTGLIQRIGYMTVDIYSSITTQLQKRVQLSRLFPATIISLFARQHAHILSFVFGVTSNTSIQKYIYLVRNSVVDGNLFVHKQLAFSRRILLNVFNTPFRQVELRRNAVLSPIVTIPPKLIGIVRPFIIILTELAKKRPGIVRVSSTSITSFVNKRASLLINWRIKSTTSIQKTVIFLRMTYGIVAEIAVKQFQLPRKTFATIAASDIQKRVNLIKDFPISTTISMARTIRQAGQTAYLITSVITRKYISILKTDVITATETILYGAGHLYFMTLTAMLGVTSSIKTFVKTRSPFRKAHIAPANNVPGATGLGEKTAIIRGSVANNIAIVTEKINKISHLNSLGSMPNTGVQAGRTHIITPFESSNK